MVEEVRARDEAAVGRLRIGMSPTARYGVGPALLAAAADGVPGVMLYPREDTTGALLRDVRGGRLDLAVLFCPARLDGVASRVLAEERAVVHLRADHPLAARPSVALEELAGETLLVAESVESGGFTARVLEMCRARGFEPATRPDPYPDLGLQAVREGLGVVVYVRGAFPPELPGSAFVPVEPAATFPFTHRLARGDPLRAGRGGPGCGVGVGRGKLPTTRGPAAGELVACSPDSSSAPRRRCSSPLPPPALPRPSPTPRAATSSSPRPTASPGSR